MKAEDEIEVQTVVPAQMSPTTVLDYLAGRFTYLTPAEWRRFLLEGRIQVDGHLAEPGTTVGAGAVVTSLLPAPAADIPPYTIIYEDAWLLAVDKPAGLRVHGRGPFIRANLIYHLRQHGYPDASLVNRLDSNTSGVVVIAKTAVSLPALQTLFRTQQVEKQYLAWVHGQPALAGSIAYSLSAIKGGDERRRYVRPNPAGRPARTDFRRLQQGEQFALLRLWPRTGRTHQLRAHLAALGHPIAGDWQYGCTADRETLQLTRHLLHCQHTCFDHPWLRQTITLTAPIPADFLQEPR